LAPGFAQTLIKPFPAGLAWARGTVPTPHGDIRVEWRRDAQASATDKPEAGFELTATIPEGIEAHIELPNGTSVTRGAGTHVVR
jgi:alpha-L-rhamnosidase